MKKILLSTLLFLHAISVSGCYTHLMLRQNTRVVKGDDYIVVEEPLDDVSENFNDDVPIYDDYETWDWGLCFDPFYSPYYSPWYNIWPWPVFYSYSYPYLYSNWYSGFYSGFGFYLYPYSNYTSVLKNKRRHFDRREPFSRFSSTENGSSINKISAIRKPVQKKKFNFINKLRETYHRISRYNSGNSVSIGSITEAISRRASSSSSSGTSSHSRSSSNSSGSRRKRK